MPLCEFDNRNVMAELFSTMLTVAEHQG